MRKSFKSTLSAIAVLLCAAPLASAQSFNSGYFLDNYVYKYRLNPSLMPEKSFLAIGVGNVNAEIKTDLAISSFLYPTDKGLVTGLNQAISSQEFLSHFDKSNGIIANANVNLFAWGIRKEKKFSCLEVNLRVSADAFLPRDLFAFLKDGSSQQNFDFSPLAVDVNAMVELAYARSRYIGDKFILGYKLKVLQAFGVDMKCNTLGLAMNNSYIKGEGNANVNLAIGPITLNTNDDGSLDLKNLKPGVNLNGFKPNLGGAIDLGFTWEPTRNLKLTAGVTDLGFVSYKYNYVGSAQASASYEGFQLDPSSDIQASLKEQFDAKIKELGKCYSVSFDGKTYEKKEMLPYTIDLGARLRIPFLRRLSVGAFYTYKNMPGIKNGGYSDLRAGATLTPFNWLSASVNMGKSSIGKVCGAAASITLLGINVWAGVDAYMGSLGLWPAPEGLTLPIYGQNIPFPVDSFRYSVNLGVTWQLFGHRYSDLKKKK